MGVAKICGHCSRDFFTPNRRHETVKYCSRDCKTAAGWEEIACPVCATSFKRKKSDGKRSEVKYCSPACYRATLLGRSNKVPADAPRYYKVCETCSKDFRVTETRKDSARWCSRECQKFSPTFKSECSEVQQGDKSWRWTGGTYQNKHGYVRSKQKVNGVETAKMTHREIVLELMLISDPSHPFILEVGGMRKLDSLIEVHHIDRDRSNNAPSNLLAVTKFAHSQIHHRNRKPDPWECWPSNPDRW